MLQSGFFEIDCLPVAALDAGADLGGRPTQFGLLVGVDRLLHAGGAGRAVGSFKAAMQTVMPQGSVAVAVAGLLVQDGGNRGGHLVGDDLILMGEIDSGELVAAEDWWQGLTGGAAL